MISKDEVVSLIQNIKCYSLSRSFFLFFFFALVLLSISVFFFN